jgi:hypothetical protein
MPLQDENCTPCNKSRKLKISTKYNVFTGILLAILPKCPFCVMAYSSTVFICGKDTLIENHQQHNSPISIVVVAFFCALILIGLLLNFRGTRTKYALLFAGLGIFIILKTMIRSGGQELYYSGVTIVFIAVWLNGSLLSILTKIKNTFSGVTKTAEGSIYS